jgi:hypothetical protein
MAPILAPSNGPSGTIPDYWKSVTIPFVVIAKIAGENLIASIFYFDQVTPIAQLGVS